MDKYALLVEDDIEQTYFTSPILEENGFQVSMATNYMQAIETVAAMPRPVDLVILDRRLPRRPEDEPTDTVGDDLLSDLLVSLPDSLFIVFTGHTGIPHHQFATRERGIIEVVPNKQPLDRVCNFEKWQTNEFEDYVKQVSDLVESLTDVELIDNSPATPLSAISRRLLRKVAHHFGGASIAVVPMSGGLAGLPVWRCKVRDRLGHDIASVVVKQSDGSKVPPGAGIHTILPAAYVAAPTDYVAGLCDGYRAQIMQLAGSDPTSLLALLAENEQQASVQLGLVADAISTTSSTTSVTRTVSQLVAPLVKWESLSELLRPFGIRLPRGGMIASTRISAQHGDLHPGNILVVDGHPVLIDFDNEVMASRALDPLTALLSPLFHSDSPVRNSDWPSLEQCEQVETTEFLSNCPFPTWTARAHSWFESSVTSERERRALIFAYAARQLKYPDILADDSLKARAVALARSYALKLAQE